MPHDLQKVLVCLQISTEAGTSERFTPMIRENYDQSSKRLKDSTAESIG